MRISDWSSDVCSSDLPFPRRFNSCCGQPEVGTSVVGVDEKNAVMLIHVIFAARLARGDKARLRQRIVGREKPDLAGHMIAGRNGNPFFRTGEANADRKSTRLNSSH